MADLLEGTYFHILTGWNLRCIPCPTGGFCCWRRGRFLCLFGIFQNRHIYLLYVLFKVEIKWLTCSVKNVLFKNTFWCNPLKLRESCKQYLESQWLKTWSSLNAHFLTIQIQFVKIAKNRNPFWSQRVCDRSYCGIQGFLTANSTGILSVTGICCSRNWKMLNPAVSMVNVLLWNLNSKTQLSG